MRTDGDAATTAVLLVLAFIRSVPDAKRSDYVLVSE